MGVQLPSEPINRHEQYLAKIAGQAVEIPAEPLTREEAYLDYIAKHGGGGGGTGDYDELLNQPKINDVTLKGNKSASDLGLASASALANKVDKVAGKDLSSNDYSDSEKQKNADNATAISAIKDGATIDSFADVESALSNKQDTLTAGDYISLNNGNIAVNRNIVRDNYAYNIKFSGDNDLTVTKSQGGTVISTTQYTYEYGSGGGVTYTIDDAFTLETIYYGGQYFKYTALRDSTTHSAGYTWQVEAHDTSTDVTEYFPTEDLSGYKLVIKSELDAAISSAYHHAGTKTCAELVVGLLVAANEGNVYNMTDSGTTTSDFIEGAGQPIKAGDNVGVAKISDGVYKFDLLSGFVDTSNFVQKSVTAGLLKNDGTVNDEIEGDVSTLKSGLTNLTDHVDGDATTYTYADVITVEDAVPANLADCSVKVEPVQDLHGYDKPWVGGAGTNKLPINNDVATQSDSGITWFMDNGSMSIDGTASSTVRNESGNYALAVASYVIKGTEYFKLFCGGGNFSGALGLRLYFTDNTYIEAIRTRAQDTVIIKSLSTHVGKTVKGIGYYINSGCVFDHNTYSMAIVENEDDTWTPYENICPISGHTEAVVTRDGKNLAENNLDTSSALAGVTITKNPDGSMDCNGTITNTGYTRLFNDNLNLQVGQTYTISGMASTMGMRLYFLDKDQTEISRINCYGTPVTFEVPQNTVTTKANILTGSKDSVVDVTVYPQVELGSTATPYEPYSGQQYTLALGDTIYVGTVDFNTGIMKVRHIKEVLNGNENAFNYGASSGCYGIKPSTINKKPMSTDDYCSIAKVVAKNYSQLQDNEACMQDGVIFTIKSSAFPTTGVEDFKQYIADLYTAGTPMECVLELATPTTVQLTPTQIQLLQGTNTLYASTGDISVTVNGVSGAIGAVQTQANATDNALAQLAADIAEQLPDAPTTDGTYVLTVTVADGAATYSWESAE